LGEVIKIQVNIVGIFSESEELTEIANAARLFVVEERVIDLTDSINPKEAISKTPVNPPNKTNKPSNSYNTNIKYLTVRGFN
jgi:hypothetical protein